MSHQNRREINLRSLCAEWHEGDGVDPREDMRPGRRRTKLDRKTQQLSRQIQRTLDQVLSGEVADEFLNGLRVVSMVPIAGGSRFLVTLESDRPIEQVSVSEIEKRLDGWKGTLRREVARSIHRRKTPELEFRIIPRLPENQEPPYGS
ncbi:MAG: ribosome-binding factor A [Planctomycetaceae bacterium]|nr:ribosome-binding factor A [Planctomycetaceae bacterium]